MHFVHLLRLNYQNAYCFPMCKEYLVSKGFKDAILSLQVFVIQPFYSTFLVSSKYSRGFNCVGLEGIYVKMFLKITFCLFSKKKNIGFNYLSSFPPYPRSSLSGTVSRFFSMQKQKRSWAGHVDSKQGLQDTGEQLKCIRKIDREEKSSHTENYFCELCVLVMQVKIYKQRSLGFVNFGSGVEIFSFEHNFTLRLYHLCHRFSRFHDCQYV